MHTLAPLVSYLELAGVVSQFDLEQEAVLPHLVLGLPLQLLHQAVQQTLGLQLILGVLQLHRIPGLPGSGVKQTTSEVLSCGTWVYILIIHAFISSSLNVAHTGSLLSCVTFCAFRTTLFCHVHTSTTDVN